MGDKHKRIPAGWHKGKPPAVGWWPASKNFDSRCLRWWNGEKWSVAFYVDKTYTEHEINFWAGVWENVKDGAYVFWADRPDTWPPLLQTTGRRT